MLSCFLCQVHAGRAGSVAAGPEGEGGVLRDLDQQGARSAGGARRGAPRVQRPQGALHPGLCLVRFYFQCSVLFGSERSRDFKDEFVAPLNFWVI